MTDARLRDLAEQVARHISRREFVRKTAILTGSVQG